MCTNTREYVSRFKRRRETRSLTVLETREKHRLNSVETNNSVSYFSTKQIIRFRKYFFIRTYTHAYIYIPDNMYISVLSICTTRHSMKKPSNFFIYFFLNIWYIVRRVLFEWLAKWVRRRRHHHQRVNTSTVEIVIPIITSIRNIIRVIYIYMYTFTRTTVCERVRVCMWVGKLKLYSVRII